MFFSNNVSNIRTDIKETSDNLNNYILFNKIMKEETVPKSWVETITKILYKKGDILLPESSPEKGDILLTESYCPISLVNVILKLFTLILLNMLT